MEKVLTTLIVMSGLCFITSELARSRAPESGSVATGFPQGSVTVNPTVPVQNQDPSTRAGLGVPFSNASGTADSNQDMIAVTGIDLTGASILYLIDTRHYQLAIYQAQGGSRSSRRVVLVGARRIDYDMQLQGYNDKSEWAWDDFDEMFSKLPEEPGSRRRPRKAPAGVEIDRDGR